MPLVKCTGVDTLLYERNAISADAEDCVISAVYDEANAAKWTELRGRRLLEYGGHPHEKGMLERPLPAWLSSNLVRELDLRDIYDTERTPNHALVNSYEPGEGIMPHEDGPMYDPIVSIFSAESPLALEFVPHRNMVIDQPERDVQPFSFAMWLEPRSLVVWKDAAYTEFLHSVAQRCWEVIDISNGRLLAPTLPNVDGTFINASPRLQEYAASGFGFVPILNWDLVDGSAIRQLGESTTLADENGNAMEVVTIFRRRRTSFTIRRVKNVLPKQKIAKWLRL